MRLLIGLLAIGFAFISLPAFAALQSDGLLNSVLVQFTTSAKSWGDFMVSTATYLYWSLVAISIVWTGVTMVFRQASLVEFAGELFRFILFVGFFWWVLLNAPTIIIVIYESFMNIGEKASGIAAGTAEPSGILDIGFNIFNKYMDNIGVFNLATSLVGAVIALAIVILLALIAIQMLLLLITGWIYGYAGIIYLGFGGSKWTSEMALSYYKGVLAIAVQIMALILIIGMGNTFMQNTFAKMSNDASITEMLVLMISSLILYMLTKHVPPLLSSVANFSVGQAGAVGGGAAGIMAAAGVAAPAIAALGAGLVGGGASIAGAGSAIMAAAKSGANNLGSDSMSSMGEDNGGSKSGSILRQVATAASNLGKATAQEAGSQVKSSMGDRVSSTMGGRIAERLRRGEGVEDV